MRFGRVRCWFENIIVVAECVGVFGVCEYVVCCCIWFCRWVVFGTRLTHLSGLAIAILSTRKTKCLPHTKHNRSDQTKHQHLKKGRREGLGLRHNEKVVFDCGAGMG